MASDARITEHGVATLSDEAWEHARRRAEIIAPLAIIALASIIGMVLWGLMMGALYALSWITGLAATAAGATGVVGFCWLCITELTKKGAEHVITPEI